MCLKCKTKEGLLFSLSKHNIISLDFLYPFEYTIFMNVFFQTDIFAHWLSGLKDAKTKARVLDRLKSAEFGNFGECSPVGEGISEMRLHFGAGYRIYFWQAGSQVYWLLAGGDKSSQKRDITRAKALRREIEETNAKSKQI
jgi:putative addiction module killer protein